jgi:hypothetical protein
LYIHNYSHRLKRKKAELTQNTQVAAKAISRVANLDKVNDIIEKARETSKSIIENEELLRQIETASANPADIIAQYGKSGAWKFSNYSDSIFGRNVECYDEEIQCDIYEEVRELMEEQLEEENLINPAPDKERKYDRGKKKVCICLIIITNTNIILYRFIIGR